MSHRTLNATSFKWLGEHTHGQTYIIVIHPHPSYQVGGRRGQRQDLPLS